MATDRQRAKPSDPLPGDTIAERYLLLREIARGGMGLVFEAEHRFTGRRLAIKLVRADQSHVPGLPDRLLEEARMLGTIAHPGIVEVHDAGIEADGRPYVAMEMLEGRTLEGILTVRGRLPIADTVQVGVQICEALAFVHAHGVVHRDLKPGNVFIVRDRKGHELVKLIDFGVATPVVATSNVPRPSANGGPVGTISYMALEQLLARPVDTRSDVYATAVTLYECLSGQVPLVGNYGEILSALATGSRPPPLSSFRRDVSPMLSAALEAALAGDMMLRTPDPLTFARALLDGAEIERGESALLGLAANDGLRDDGAREGGDGEEAPVLLARRREQPIELQRRRSPRLPYVTPVRLFSGSQGLCEARCEEISSTGMLLLCEAKLSVGEIVNLKFALPMTGAIATVEAVIRWMREARGRSALGLEFRNVPETARAPIDMFVSQPVAADAR